MITTAVTTMNTDQTDISIAILASLSTIAISITATATATATIATDLHTTSPHAHYSTTNTQIQGWRIYTGIHGSSVSQEALQDPYERTMNGSITGSLITYHGHGGTGSPLDSARVIMGEPLFCVSHLLRPLLQ